MSEFHEGRAASLLRSVIYMIVGTSSNEGAPWSSPVYFSCDEEVNLYWASDKQSVHSRNIRDNDQVLLVVYNSAAPEGKFIGEGVYFEATARELNEPQQVQAARRVMQNRKGIAVAEEEYRQFTANAVRRIYKATPRRAWVNDVETDDSGNYVRDIRIDVGLKEIQSRLTSSN